MKGFRNVSHIGKRGHKPNKYRNEKVALDGIKFDSKKERDRYAELEMLERAGAIKALVLQPKFDLMCGGKPVKIRDKNGVGRQSRAVLDFQYVDAKSGALVVEDVKGMDTPISRLKRALLEAEYGIKVVVL